MANIKDVARQAGVSISTVSRVINDSKSVSSPLRVKVEKAIDDLNYSTNSIARGLKSSQTNNIEMCIRDSLRILPAVPSPKRRTYGLPKPEEEPSYGIVMRFFNIGSTAPDGGFVTNSFKTAVFFFI